MYPENMTKLYSNLTPRKSRLKGVESVVVFGTQHFILEYLIEKFNKEFFLTRFRENGEYEDNVNTDQLANMRHDIIEEYKRHCPVDTKHIEELWDLGYLPLEIKCLEEGTLCPIGVPMLTITNTHPKFGWLVNYLETLLSCMLWQSITSATIAREYRKLLDKYALETTGNTEGVQWQGHDFSMRGMSSPESSILSGMSHLLSFTGTDTIPAIYQLEKSYKAEGLIGASVPATEHSVMCMGTKEDEINTISRLLKTYPTGILSIVLDTWDQTRIAKPAKDGILYQLKDEILARDGKLVDRPDSGDPVDIICGKLGNTLTDREKEAYYPEFYFKGLIECLWDIFGGTINEQGYKVLDSHIGAIYGDSISLERAEQISERLKAKGFASTNVVYGIGSFTYQYNTRDTFGFAMKATYGEITHYAQESDEQDTIEAREIFKDPITDDGTKKSKKGLLRITTGNGGYRVEDQQTWAGEKASLLETVFLDGKLTKFQTLEEIRNRLNKN
jgi:nicotinamide phosphoribosyltransferase